MKRLFALVLTLALLLCAMAVPASAEEPTTIRWLHKAWNASTMMDNFWDAYWVRHLEEKFNVKIDFMGITPSDDYDAIVNLTIADSDNWPDIMYWNWDSYPGGVAAAIDDGLVQPLNTTENWEELMPTFSQLLKDNAYIRRALTLDDGAITGAAHVEETIARNAYSGYGIRADWLRNVGKEVPTTVDELYDVLTAFKEQDANGNGDPTDEIPMTEFKEYFLFQQLSGAWGIVWNNMQIDPETGKVNYWATVNDGENFKEFAETMHKWYAEGLIDPEFSTQDRDSYGVKNLNDKIGFTFLYPGETTSIPAQMKDVNPNAEFVGMGLLKGKYDRAYSSNVDMAKWVAAEQLNVVTTAAGEKTELILQMLDYMYSDEFTDIIAWGEEGVSFEYDEEGNPRYTDAMYNEDGSLNGDLINTYALGGRGQWPRYMNYAQWLVGNCPDEKCLETHLKYADVDTALLLPPLTVPIESSSEYTGIMSEVKTAVIETFVQVVLGTKDVSELDKLQDILNGMNIDRAIEIYQAAYDNYESK